MVLGEEGVMEIDESSSSEGRSSSKGDGDPAEEDTSFVANSRDSSTCDHEVSLLVVPDRLSGPDGGGSREDDATVGDRTALCVFRQITQQKGSEVGQ